MRRMFSVRHKRCSRGEIPQDVLFFVVCMCVCVCAPVCLSVCVILVSVYAVKGGREGWKVKVGQTNELLQTNKNYSDGSISTISPFHVLTAVHTRDPRLGRSIMICRQITMMMIMLLVRNIYIGLLFMLQTIANYYYE